MRLLATLAAVAVGIGPLWAYGSGSGDDAAGAAFLKITPSVLGEALGGMNPAAVEGAQAMGINPAAIHTGGKNELTSGFATMIGDSTYGTLGASFGRSKNMTVGMSATFLQSGQLEGRDLNGNLTVDFAARDMAAGLTAAWGLGSFRAGVTAKAVRQEIGEFKSNVAPAGDFGMAFRTGTIGWGLAALNVGSGIKFEGRESALPTMYSLGASVPLGGGITGLAGMTQVSGETTANMGLEYKWSPVSLRVGYRSEGGGNLARSGQKSSEQALGGLTGGLGFAMEGWRLDYAVSQTAVEYGMSHRAAVTFLWGGEEVQKERPARRREARRTERRPEPKSTGSEISTGSRRAYDPVPFGKPAPKKKKTWVR